ncbi:MAG: hypothetical protein PHT64_01120 [Bacteroidales bacterium]|nr:hypothetical protein [Bacteroidales bacterium]MDD4031506.1 hypothetical protein [Bacteroidales bacterium]MDD4435486.1 hypothetical protein [Bacteroidales bacterium]MDD5732381.1 hypothetical protein [Bacteroidales bacterium]
MSDIFNVKRFNAFVCKELRELPGNYGLSILSMIGGYLFCLLVMMMLGASFSPFTRMTIIMVYVTITIIAAPSKLHGNVNHPRKGLAYIMLPVSALEKTLSMFVINFLCTTLIIVAGLFAADMLVFLIVPSRMEGFLLNNTTALFMGEGIIELFFLQSIFILGNMVFKRQKIVRTFISLLGIVFLFGLVMLLVFRIIGLENIERFADTILAEFPKEIDRWDIFSYRTFNSTYRNIPIIRNIIIVSYSVIGLITAACWVGVYRLIKTTKY